MSQQTTTVTNRARVMHAVIHAWYMSGLISRSDHIAVSGLWTRDTAIYWSYTVYTNAKVVHMISIDQWNSTRQLYKVQVRVIYSHAMLVTVMSECSEKRVLVKPGLRHWQTVHTDQMLQSVIRFCTVCLKYKQIRVKLNSLTSPFRTIFPCLHSETIDSPVLSVLWLLWVVLRINLPSARRYVLVQK